MARPVFRVCQVTVLTITSTLLVGTLVFRPIESVELLILATLLVAVAAFVRIEGESPVGFESAVVFGATIATHDASVALIAMFVGSAIHALYQAVAKKCWRFDIACNTAQPALSYFVVALLYTLAVARDAPAMAKVSGYILLVVGYLVVYVLFAALRRRLEDGGAPLDFRRVLLVQGRMLMLVSPIVAVEVMLYGRFGTAGFAIGFLPVLIIAYAMRNEAEAERQNAELLRRNKELAILTESSTQILSAESDDETMRRLMMLLSSLAQMKASAVVTWETGAEGPPTIYRFGECMPNDQEIIRWVDSAGFAQSAPSRAFIFRDDFRRFPLASGNAVQILIGIQTPEVIYGILIYETEEPSILGAGSLNLLTLLVNQTALSLQDQLLRRAMREKTMQLEAQASTMSTILEVSNSLIGLFDVDEALTRLSQAVRKALGFEVVVAALHDTKCDDFVRRAHSGLDDVWDEVKRKRVSRDEIRAFLSPEFRISNSYFVSHTALRQGDHDFFVRPEDGAGKPAEEWHDNDILITPLMSGEQMVGYLSVRAPHDRRVPTLEKVQTLEIFAVLAITALQCTRQYEEIKRLTFVDALTPAFNHRYFQEALAKEIHRHSRTGHEMGLAMLDIDDFKRINDTFGHPVGDEILKGLVEELMTNARDSDIVARYGGEEFAIIFPDIPGRSAADAANRMRDLVERREFKVPQLNRVLRITVSVGVAIYPGDGVTNADLISRADAALYFAKKNGKNRVAIATEVFGAVETSAES